MDLDVDKEENEGQPFCEQTDQKLALASAEAINQEEIEQECCFFNIKFFLRNSDVTSVIKPAYIW